jgi:hypothetical protein
MGMKKIMSKKTMRDLVVGFIEEHAYCTLIVVLSITLVFAIAFKFGRIDTISDPEELARLITSITFPMSGILLFVLNQSLDLRGKYSDKRNVLDRIVDTYTQMSVISAITLIGSAVTGLCSFQYFKSAGDTWLVVAIYAFLLLLVLLIVNTVFFTIYTLTVKKTIRIQDDSL